MSLPLVPFPKTGYICAWAPDNELRVLGKRNGFLRPLGGGLVSAQRLEAVYAHRCPMVHQIWVHCESQTPLVAGGSPSPGRRKKRSKSLLGRVTAGA